MKKLSLLALLLTFVWTSMVVAAEKGWFGFGLKVEGSGFLSLTVQSVTVESIAPHSPASEQSIAVGDEIIQVEEMTVPGRRAWELKPLLQKQVGETIHLRLKRPTGETYSVTLTAVKRRD
jgi:C-terminal processing protease CtpA/Prc